MYKKQWKKLTKGVTNIERNEFMEWTNGVWTFNGESKKRVGHPAPFPIELPSRCIKLFSYEGDLILDPFVGSGSTLVACRQLSRTGIGFDIDSSYLELALKRVQTLGDSKLNRKSISTLEKPKKKKTRDSDSSQLLIEYDSRQ
jgi:site-specific DNA-methyltransferase (adenine-specific)